MNKIELVAWRTVVVVAWMIAAAWIVPLTPVPADARLIELTPEDDSGGYRLCINVGYNGTGIGYCWHVQLPLEPAPEPPPQPLPAHPSTN